MHVHVYIQCASNTTIICICTTPLIETGYFLCHFRVGSGGFGFSLLSNLVESIHVGLVSSHLLLEGLCEREGECMCV